MYYGDLGNENAIIAYTSEGNSISDVGHDAYVGNFAYNLHTVKSFFAYNLHTVGHLLFFCFYLSLGKVSGRL